MAINPHIAHYTGRYRRLDKTKKRVLWKLIETRDSDPIVRFVEYRSKARQSSLYLDTGNNRLDRDEDILLSRDRSQAGANKRRRGRFKVDLYRIESPPDMSDKQPGWVGPGTLIGYGTEVSMDNGLTFSIREDLFEQDGQGKIV